MIPNGGWDFCRRSLRIALLSALFCAFGSSFLHAQSITADGTASTTVNPIGSTYEITNGTRAGSNLFHSFAKFGLNTGEIADFRDTTGGGIANIISRVTGGEVSSIDGLIRSSSIPGANLFLINPAGMIFGPNASLDVGGSFHATTADRVLFPDGKFFSATDTNASTFTVDHPAKFGFLGDNPGRIDVMGTGRLSDGLPRLPKLSVPTVRHSRLLAVL